jgi:hypothetical protein
MRAAVATQYKFRLVGAALAMRSSLARPQSSLPIARAISCQRRHLSEDIETTSCARSTAIGTLLFAAQSPTEARCGKTAALSNSVAMVLASL